MTDTHIDVPIAVAEPVDGGFHESNFEGENASATFIEKDAKIVEGENDQNASASAAKIINTAQFMIVVEGAKTFAKKVNPFQGVSNVNEARLAVLKEAKDLFNPTAFSKPKDRAELTSRLSANSKHFRLSYTITYGLTSIWFLLSSPFLLFEIFLITGLWALFFKFNGADDVVSIGQYKLGRKEKLFVIGTLSLFVAFFGGLISSLIYMCFLGTLVVGTHASFRQIVEADPLDDLEGSGMIPPPQLE